MEVARGMDGMCVHKYYSVESRVALDHTIVRGRCMVGEGLRRMGLNEAATTVTTLS